MKPNYKLNQKIKDMRGFATSFNPFTSGLKPRSFFSARVEMLRREQMMKKVDKDCYPKWKDSKKDKI